MEFNTKNLTNRMIHLTNDAVQKKSENYGKYENGNKVNVDYEEVNCRCPLPIFLSTLKPNAPS